MTVGYVTLYGKIITKAKNRIVEINVEAIVSRKKVKLAEKVIVNAVKHYSSIRPIGTISKVEFITHPIIQHVSSGGLVSLTVKLNGVEHNLYTMELSTLIAEELEGIMIT